MDGQQPFYEYETASASVQAKGSGQNAYVYQETNVDNLGASENMYVAVGGIEPDAPSEREHSVGQSALDTMAGSWPKWPKNSIAPRRVSTTSGPPEHSYDVLSMPNEVTRARQSHPQLPLNATHLYAGVPVLSSSRSLRFILLLLGIGLAVALGAIAISLIALQNSSSNSSSPSTSTTTNNNGGSMGLSSSEAGNLSTSALVTLNNTVANLTRDMHSTLGVIAALQSALQQEQSRSQSLVSQVTTLNTSLLSLLNATSLTSIGVQAEQSRAQILLTQMSTLNATLRQELSRGQAASNLFSLQLVAFNTSLINSLPVIVSQSEMLNISLQNALSRVDGVLPCPGNSTGGGKASGCVCNSDFRPVISLSVDANVPLTVLRCEYAPCPVNSTRTQSNLNLNNNNNNNNNNSSNTVMGGQCQCLPGFSGSVTFSEVTFSYISTCSAVPCPTSIASGNTVLEGCACNNTLGYYGTGLQPSTIAPFYTTNTCLQFSSCDAIFNQTLLPTPFGKTSGIYYITYLSNLSFPVYCDMETDGGGWTMVYKISAGSGVSAYNAWLNTTNEANNSALTITSTPAAGSGAYTNRLATTYWNKGGVVITNARVHVYKAGQLKKFLKFNTVGTTSTSWFSLPFVLSSSWTDLSTAGQNVFSIVGFLSVAGLGRRWYISQKHLGCASDSGWLSVSGVNNCEYESATPKPNIFYAPDNNVTTWMNNSATADVLAVFIK